MYYVYTQDGRLVREARTLGGARKFWQPGYFVESRSGCNYTNEVEEYKGPSRQKITWAGQPHEVPRRDSQMAKVYAAEREAFGSQFARVVLGGDLKLLQQLVDAIHGSQFWADLNLRAGHRPGSLGDCKLRPGSGPATGGRYRGIKLPPWARSVAILLHEMAHVVAPSGSGHHWPFAACYVALVEEYMGEAQARALRAAFRKHRVRYLPPRSVELSVAACKPEG